jgi:hypothetical protein
MLLPASQLPSEISFDISLDQFINNELASKIHNAALEFKKSATIKVPYTRECGNNSDVFYSRVGEKLAALGYRSKRGLERNDGAIYAVLVVEWD